MDQQCPQASLIISSPGQSPREEIIRDGASIGSAAENSLRVQGAGVGRYHLFIEKREDRFWVRELDRSEATTLNDAPLASEQPLKDGDRLMLGGKTEVEFHLVTKAAAQDVAEGGTAEPKAVSATTSGTAATSAATAALAFSTGRVFKLMVILLPVMLVVIAVIALAVSKYVPGPECREPVRIVSPIDGETVSGRKQVRVTRSECVKRLVWRLDQQVIPGSSSIDNFWLDPEQLKKQIPDLTGKAHELSVVGEDRRGREIPGNRIRVTFVENLVETAQLREMLNQFADKVAPHQHFDDDDFVNEIGRRLNYTVELVELVAQARYDICRTFFTQGLPAQLGPALALSRQRLTNQSPSSDEELERYSFWRMPRRLLHGWLKPQELEESLRDQRRAAELTSDYLKRLQDSLQKNLPPGDRDFTYSVACFGMDPDVARDQIASRLSVSGEEYHNFWRMKERLDGVLPPGAAERVADFFAAGVVAGNLARFNLNVPSFDDACGR